MKAKIEHIITLLLTILLLLFCSACGQTQTEQPEDTGDKDLSAAWIRAGHEP